MTTVGMDRWLSSADVAEIIGRTMPGFYSLRARGTAPPGYRIGGKLRFRASEVEAWLTDHRDDPADRLAV